MPTTGRGRGNGDGESPVAPPIPSFASLRAPRRSHPAMDVLAPPPAVPEPERPAELPFPAEPSVAVGARATTAGGGTPPGEDEPAPARRPAPASWPTPASGPTPASWPTPAHGHEPAPGPAPAAAPRPAEWADLLSFGVRVASAALRLPGVLACAPARGLRRLLGE